MAEEMFDEARENVILVLNHNLKLINKDIIGRNRQAKSFVGYSELKSVSNDLRGLLEEKELFQNAIKILESTGKYQLPIKEGVDLETFIAASSPEARLLEAVIRAALETKDK